MHLKKPVELPDALNWLRSNLIFAMLERVFCFFSFFYISYAKLEFLTGDLLCKIMNHLLLCHFQTLPASFGRLLCTQVPTHRKSPQ